MTTSRRLTFLTSLVLTLAACGGGSGVAAGGTGEVAAAGVASLEADGAEPDQAGEVAAEVDTEARLLEFSQCMRDQGIDIGDPTVDTDGNVSFGGFRGGPGGDGEGRPEGIRAAFEECGDLLDGAQLGFRDRDRTEFSDQLLAFARCMRDEGIDIQDPDFSNFGGDGDGDGDGDGGRGGIFGDLDLEDPDVAAAQEACSDVLGGFGPGGGFGAGDNH